MAKRKDAKSNVRQDTVAVLRTQLAEERAAHEKQREATNEWAEQVTRMEKERDEWRAKAMDVEQHPVVVAVRSERDAALANNAALWRIVLKAAPAIGVLARAREVAPEIRAELLEAERLLLAGGRHPGAVLLEEHQKALAHARSTALHEADAEILKTAHPPAFFREHHPNRNEYEAAISGYSVGVNHALDTIRAMLKEG